jgi:hypothetical protein
MTRYNFHADDYIGSGRGFALAESHRSAVENICAVRKLGKIKRWYIDGNSPATKFYTTFGFEILIWEDQID